MDGSMDANPQSLTWPGKVAYAGPLPIDGRGYYPDYTGPEDLAYEVGMRQSDIVNNDWLTVFEDNSSPRPGVADVTFTRSSTQSQVETPPVHWPDPEDPIYPIELWVVPLAILAQRGYGMKAKPGRGRRAVIIAGSVALGAVAGEIPSFIALFVLMIVGDMLRISGR
jgi:hypothetical protein